MSVPTGICSTRAVFQYGPRQRQPQPQPELQVVTCVCLCVRVCRTTHRSGVPPGASEYPREVRVLTMAVRTLLIPIGFWVSRTSLKANV